MGVLVHVDAVEVLGLVGLLLEREEFALALAFHAVVVVVLAGGFDGFGREALGVGTVEGVGLGGVVGGVELRDVGLLEAEEELAVAAVLALFVGFGS